MTHAHDRTLIASMGFADPDKKDARHDLACQYLAQPEIAQRVVRRFRHADLQSGAYHGTEWFEYDDKFRHGLPHDAGPRFGLGYHSTSRHERVEFERTCELDTSPRFEVPIHKGEHQYRTTIGYLDLVVPYTITERRAGRRWGVCLVEREVEEKRERFVHTANEGANDGAMPRPAWLAKRLATHATRLETYAEAVRKPVPEEAWLDYESVHRRPGVVLVEVKIRPVGVGELLRQIKLYQSYPLLRSLHTPLYPGPEEWMVATAYALPSADVASLKSEGVGYVRLGPKFDEYVAQRQRNDAREVDEDVL